MNPAPSLTPAELSPVIDRLSAANRDFLKRYPGESHRRQPVHVVYGGAHLFKADTARRLGDVSRKTLTQYAPDGAALAKALGADWSQAFATDLHARITAKLEHEAVEDFRLDFEDGYGSRPDAEEDAHAISSARVAAQGRCGNPAPIPRDPHQALQRRHPRPQHQNHGPLPDHPAGSHREPAP